MSVYEDIKTGLEEAIAYERGKAMERLTKREGKHTIRIGNEWRRNDPVWDRLAYYEDLLEEATKMLESYEQHGDVYAINNDNTLGEKIGTCSMIKGIKMKV